MAIPHDLNVSLDAVPGTVSVWSGPLGGPPEYARLPDARHYAASTMKVAVLAAVYATDDSSVLVRNDFPSAAPGAGVFRCTRSYDNDDEVWALVGRRVSLRWLARRMIVRSSNLATNLCLTAVGFDAVAEVWRLAGARYSSVGRYIEDGAARERGITNEVTAADLAALLTLVARDGRMVELLLADEHRSGLPEGLPPGTRMAHKGGWVAGIRHGAGIVYGAAPHVLVCLTTSALEDAAACRILARVAAALSPGAPTVPFNPDTSG